MSIPRKKRVVKQKSVKKRKKIRSSKKQKLVMVTRSKKKQVKKKAKKKSAEWFLRSERSKKGWVTRRKNIKKEKTIQSSGFFETLFNEAAKNLNKSEISKLTTLDAQKQLEHLVITKLVAPGLLVGDYVERSEPLIMLKLIHADILGNFDEVAKELAEEYDYDAHEIYSFWHGYKLED